MSLDYYIGVKIHLGSGLIQKWIRFKSLKIINIDTNIKKYYKEFSDIKFIDERMIIYGILDDIRLLTRFDNNELKENVVNYTRKLLN